MYVAKGSFLLLGALLFLCSCGVYASTTPDSAMTDNPMDPENPMDGYQCYNFTCTSSDLNCLSRSIFSNLVHVPSCCGGGRYCKITRFSQDGQHTIVAECVEEACEYTETFCPINGDVVFNCCNDQHCNTELILGPTTSSGPRVLPAALPLTLALALTGSAALHGLA